MRADESPPDALRLDRRRLLRLGGTLACAALSGGCAARGERIPAAADHSQREATTPMLDLAELPNYCAHEHWGSLFSLGTFPGGFNADLIQGKRPERRTTLMDVLIDPYFGGCLYQAGQDPNLVVRQAGYADLAAARGDSPAAALKALRPALRTHQLTGTWQCIRRGLLELYGVDINRDDDPGAIDELDRRIGDNYARIFDWYEEVMRRARFSCVIRPVHPEFHVREDTPESAAHERRFTRSILRIDPLLELWREGETERRARLAEIAGVEPADAASWRAFIAAIMELAERHGTTGIKQLQAYHRDLDFKVRADGEVKWRGELRDGEVRVQQDWIVNECCTHAHERGWPQQFHIGTHNLPDSSPLPLGDLARRYPKMKLVLIHTWPYQTESGWLARQHPNVYLDSCWMPVLNPQYLRDALDAWLGYVPSHKIMMAHDSTSIEMAVGSSLFTREVLAERLWACSRGMGLGEDALVRYAADMLHGNAAAVYGGAATAARPQGS